MKTTKLVILSILFLSAFSLADTTLTVTSPQCTVYLPDNWIIDSPSDSQIILYDTTGTYASMISLIRHQIPATDFPTTGDWTRAFFVAYKMGVEYNYDPFGAVLYYDSTADSKQDSLWAPELYCQFFSTDTSLPNWAEYTRYTESGDHGYELYALGDTTDMATNVGVYAGIIQMIDLPESETSIVRPGIPATASRLPAAWTPDRIVDPLGRRAGLVDGRQLRAPKLYISPNRKHTPELH